MTNLWKMPSSCYSNWTASVPSRLTLYNNHPDPSLARRGAKPPIALLFFRRGPGVVAVGARTGPMVNS
jgi:hypothetical protein